MEKIRYIVPPKLRQRLLLVGLTMWELLIILALIFFNIVRHNFVGAFLWPLSYLFLMIRFFDGKSLMDILLIVLRYHFSFQFFTKSIQQKKGNLYAKRTYQ